MSPTTTSSSRRETDQIAGVEPEVKHGRFSYFVFKGLEGEADASSDGKISAGELHKYVRESGKVLSGCPDANDAR